MYKIEKKFDELDNQLQTILLKKAASGVFSLIGAIFVFSFKFMEIQLKLLVLAVALIYIGTIVYTFLIFMWDAVQWIDVTYLGRKEIDDVKKTVLQLAGVQKVMYVQAMDKKTKLKLIVRKYNDDFAKGDIIRVYTVPNNVDDGDVITVRYPLAVYLIKSAAFTDSEQEEETENVEDTFDE